MCGLSGVKSTGKEAVFTRPYQGRALPTELQRPKEQSTNFWWTGEDSNLRSSQGATGLQPVAISRSATRPALSPAVIPPKRESQLKGNYKDTSNEATVQLG